MTTKLPTKVAWGRHDRLVSILNIHADDYGLAVGQSVNQVWAELRPYIQEMLRTKTLTKEEILRTFRRQGYSDMSMEALDGILKGKKLELYTKSAKKRAAYKKLSESNVDAEIVAVCRTLPLDKVDPRIFVRYLEIIDRVPVNTGGTFLACCDALNAMEREARKKFPVSLEEGENIPFPDIEALSDVIDFT